MNLFGKYSLKELIGLGFFISYSSGFLVWNVHLSNYGYFEYNFLQTRYLSTGILSILFLCVIWCGLNIFYKSWKTIDYAVFLFLFYVIFVIFLFPQTSQSIGGGKPFVKSLISDPTEIEFLSDLNIPGMENGINKSIQTILVCEIYNNGDNIIISTIGSKGDTLRVLIMNKDIFKGFQILSPYDQRLYRKSICGPFYRRLL